MLKKQGWRLDAAYLETDTDACQGESAFLGSRAGSPIGNSAFLFLHAHLLFNVDYWVNLLLFFLLLPDPFLLPISVKNGHGPNRLEPKGNLPFRKLGNLAKQKFT